MDRLTYKTSKGNIRAKGLNERTGILEKRGGNLTVTSQNAVDLLYEYEQTGLSPHEIVQMQAKIADGRLVEVVRCGECKHWRFNPNNMCGGDCIRRYANYAHIDFYCGKGERKCENDTRAD